MIELEPLVNWREERRQPLPDDAPDYMRTGSLAPALAEDVLDRLAHRYRTEPVPPCRVCGGELSVQSMGGGRRTEWAHSKPDGVTFGDWMDHYRQSKWAEPNSGDSDVTSLVEVLRSVLA